MNHITIWGSVVAYFVMDYIYNFYLGGPYVGAIIIAMKGANFWFTALICVIILMLPVLTSRFYAVDVNPSLADKIRMKRKMQKKTKSSEDTSRTPSARKARRSLRSGYAFAHHVSFKIKEYCINLHSKILTFKNCRKDLVDLLHLEKLCENYLKISHSLLDWEQNDINNKMAMDHYQIV